jgi:putative SOS response-associated peptidase YedK
MCGRFALRNPQPVKSQFHLAELEPQYNIFPGIKILTIADEPKFIIWGYTPYWANKPFNLINARGESLRKKPSFRNAGRCIIPADGWYEWKQEDQKKYLISIIWEKALFALQVFMVAIEDKLDVQ